MFDPRIALMQLFEKHGSAFTGLKPKLNRFNTALDMQGAKNKRLLGGSGKAIKKYQAPVNDTHEAWTGIATKTPEFAKGELKQHLKGTEALRKKSLRNPQS